MSNLGRTNKTTKQGRCFRNIYIALSLNKLESVGYSNNSRAQKAKGGAEQIIRNIHYKPGANSPTAFPARRIMNMASQMQTSIIGDWTSPVHTAQ